MYAVDVCDYMYRYYITYDRLFALNKKAFYGKTDAVTANIFIDIRSFIDPLIKRNDIRFEYKDNQTPIASSILNLAIHLRNYYRTRHYTEVKIYLVWGANIVSGTGRYGAYNAVNNMAFAVNSEIKKVLMNGIELLKVLCPYLPQIYMIDCGVYETAAGIQALLDFPDKSGIYNGVPNIIYSRDPYMCQLVANNPYTFMFSCYKSADGDDNSIIVEKENIYNCFRYMNKYSNKNISDPGNASYFNMAIALSGMKCRNIKGGITFNSACNLIARYQYEIPATPHDVAVLEFALTDKKLTSAEKRAVYSINQYGMGIKEINEEININLTRHYFYNSTSFLFVFEGCVDLYSPEDIKRINERFFLNYPVDIMRL